MTGLPTLKTPSPDDDPSGHDRRCWQRLSSRIASLRSRGQHWFAARRLALIEKTTLTAALALLLVWAPGDSALAVTPGMKTVATLPQVINNATAWIVGILAIVGIFFFTLGGLRYMTANGDPAEIEKAKGAFKGAATGFALAVLAPVFMNALQKILGA